jgi:hypothetical protein
MKLNYKWALLLVLAVAIFLPTRKVRAQDTLTVRWDDPLNPGFPLKDVLYNAIKGDTNSNGTRKNLNRVYKLQQGGEYWDITTIANNGFPLRLVGQAPGPTALENPPTIQMVTGAGGAAPGHMIQVYDDLVLKNLYVIGCDENGVQTNYQPIEIENPNLHISVDGCIFERNNFSLMAWNGKNNDVYITNSKFRNLVETPPTQQWTGRGIQMWADQDTVVVENCTFFNVGFCAIQLEGGAAKYYRFNHNTLVDIGRSIHSTSGCWWREAYFANCLLVNVFWDGEAPCDYSPTYAPSRDPRAYTTGYFAIQPLPSVYGPDVGRRIVFSHMGAYLDPYFKTHYGDTIRVQGYCNAITDSFFTTYSVANGGAMVVGDTAWISAPTFPVNPNDATQLKAMWDGITAIRGYQYYGTGVQGKAYFWQYPADPTYPSWPLPENFAYTDASLMTGKTTDNLPLGDLNWFPSSKATWEAHKAQYITQIEGLAGTKKVFTVDTTGEAESATPGGTAQKKGFSGFCDFNMASGGYIDWKFNLAQGGQYDLSIWTNLQGNSMRGEHFYINGTEIHDSDFGWGELEFNCSDASQSVTTANPAWGKPNNQWIWVTYPQSIISEANALTFKTGANEIKITPSWGYQSFAGINLLNPGTTTVYDSLRAPDADYSVVTPEAPGAKWVPSRFNYVDLGTAGTVTFNLTAPQAGSYHLRIFGQNIHSAQALTVKEGSTTLTSPSLPAHTDSTGVDVLSDKFSLTAGVHTLVLSGANVNIDYIQLIQETVSSVKQVSNLPQGFALAQNYPNPFNPTTTINFSLGKASNVILTVYNILGQKVATLLDSQHMDVGTYAVQFDARNLASGVYFYRLQAGDFRSDKKMLLLK